jgi:hypothetical protein
MDRNIEETIERLAGYCKPYDQGGNGGTALAERIQFVLTEIKRLQAIVDPIEELRIDDYVVLHSGTKSGYKKEQEAVEVVACWTNGESEWFYGDTLADALKVAVEAKAAAEAAKEKT